MSTRTRKPAAERREQIAQAVLQIIGKQGLTSLTTMTIADEVGVTSGALFRHFSSLEEILEETVGVALGQMEATFPDRALPPMERLLTLAKNRIRLLGSNPGLAWLLSSEQAQLTLPKDAVVRLQELVDRSKRYLLDTITEGVSQGVIRDDIEPQVLLVPVLGTIHALIRMPGGHRASTAEPHRDPHRVLSALEQLLSPAPEVTPHRREMKITNIQ